MFISIDEGRNSTKFPETDECFKIYGPHETFLEITMIPTLFTSTVVIKNISNYITWDLMVKFTISGVLVLIER